MNLFGQYSRTDPRPKIHPESPYEFYDRVKGPFWDDVREVLEDWFSHLTSQSQVDIYGNLRDKRGRKFDGAFWELYLHELFRQLGLDFTHQPEVPRDGASSFTPDFLLDRGGDQLYVEAVTILAPETDDRKERRIFELCDWINANFRSNNFRLSFEIRAMGATTPSFSKLLEGLQTWLGGLDEVGASTVEAVQYSTGIFDGPRLKLANEGWRLEFGAIPVPVHQRDQVGGPIIAIGPSRGRISGAFDDAAYIRDRLKAKSKKYSSLGHPLMIAVLVNRFFGRSREIQQALFGNNQISPDFIRTGMSTTNSSEGLWTTSDGPDYRFVPVILGAIGLQPAQITETLPTVWQCPWASNPVGFEFPFTTLGPSLSGDSLETRPATLTPAELFGLPEVWPRGAPFP